MTVATAVLGYTLRACLPLRRWWLLALPCVGAVLFGLLARVSEDPPEQAFAQIAAYGLFALLIPIACLVIGDAVLGAEIRAGTFHFTWLSPAPVRTIVAGRWLGGWLVALVTLVPAVALSAVVAGSPQSAGAMVVATAAASAAYLGLFVLVGCVARRAAVWSLAIVFLIERLLGAALTGIAQLSPTWESRAIFLGYLDDVPSRIVRHGIPEGGAAVVRLVIVTIVALLVAIWRLGHMRFAGATD
jgi:ABC-type transport system involved in multi-copper enzyme maturation permease subunit